MIVKENHAVIQCIVDEYINLIGEPPLGYKKIVVENGGPQCVTDYLPEYYKILINNKERFWGQLVYEFSHEICHIYLNPMKNNRLIESMCEMSSLYFLDLLSKKWTITNPLDHKTYISDVLKEYKEKYLPIRNYELGIYSETNYIFKPTSSLYSNNERNLQFLAADKLVTLFQDESQFWKSLEDIGKTANSENSEFLFDESRIYPLSHSKSEENIKKIKKILS